MKKEININNVIKLFSKQSSIQLFKEAIQEVMPSKADYKAHLWITLLSIIPTIIISFAPNTIELFCNEVKEFNTIILALFAIVFTGYAFFQALIGEELLIRLLDDDEQQCNDKNEPKSKLQVNNEYFVKIMMLHVALIVINYFLNITLGSLQDEFYIFDSKYVNSTLVCPIIWVYTSFTVLIMWEMKSFIFNIFQLFNAHAGARALEIIEKPSEDKEDSEISC